MVAQDFRYLGPISSHDRVCTNWCMRDSQSFTSFIHVIWMGRAWALTGVPLDLRK